MNTAGKFIIGGLAAYGAYRVLESILRPGEEGVGKAYKVSKKNVFSRRDHPIDVKDDPCWTCNITNGRDTCYCLCVEGNCNVKMFSLENVFYLSFLSGVLR